MEFAIYAFAVVGVLALLGLIAAFVATVWTHNEQIEGLDKRLRSMDNFYDSRIDRLADRINEAEERLDGLDDFLTEGILDGISAMQKKPSTRK